MQLPTQYLLPALLRCSYFDGYAAPVASYAVRTVYEYELEYYLKSDGGIRIDGVYTPFAAGEINIRKPGQRVQGVPPYACYVLCIDFTGNSSRASDAAFGTPEEAQERYNNPLLDRLPDKLAPENGPLVASLFERLLSERKPEDDLEAFRKRADLWTLLAELFRQNEAPSLWGRTAAVRQCVRQIREHFSEPLSVEELIRQTGLSRAFFHRRFLEETGKTPGQLITYLRLEQAKNLLAITETPIADVGALSGFADGVYFSRIFRRHTGLTPSAYRRLFYGTQPQQRNHKETT